MKGNYKLAEHIPNVLLMNRIGFFVVVENDPRMTRSIEYSVSGETKMPYLPLNKSFALMFQDLQEKLAHVL